MEDNNGSCRHKENFYKTLIKTHRLENTGQRRQGSIETTEKQCLDNNRRTKEIYFSKIDT